MADQFGGIPVDEAPAAPAGKPDAFGGLPVDAPAAPPKEMSKLERFGTGLMDPIHGAAQLAANILPIPLPTHGLSDWKSAADISNEQEAKRAATIKAETPAGADWYRAAGSAANPLNYTPIGLEGQVAKVGPLASAALGGAKAGAINPVNASGSGDFWAKKGLDTAEGAAAGTALSAGGRAGAALIAPKVSAAQRALLDKGIDLTPGQMFDGTVRRTEEVLKKFPILGDFVRKGQQRSVEDFNAATINQALEPVGEKLPANLKAGRDAIGYAQEALGAKYDALLPQMRFQADAAMQSDVQNLKVLTQELPPDQRQSFATILKQRVMDRLGTQGSMDGQTLKQVESELNQIAGTYSTSSDAAQRQLGTALREVQTAIRSALERQNPAQAQELANINAGYAMLVRAENASTRRAGSEGVFTPMDLLSAVKAGDKTTRNRAFARGDALMQDWAEAAQKVLPNKMPDSGTAERLGYLGAGAAAATHPVATAAGATAILPYTKGGMALLRKYVETNPAKRADIGRALVDAVDAGAPLSAVLAHFGIADPGDAVK